MASEQSSVLSKSKQDDLFEIVDGICWVSDWGSSNLRFALSYQAKVDDLLIVTYPRSGTTWMQNIVYTLLTKGEPFDANIDHFFQQNPHLEIDGRACIEMMKQPGAIKTHLPMHRIPYSSLAKYIAVIRNPKDVCISYYIFYNMWPDVPKLDFNEFFECFIEGYLPFGDYFEALRSAWKHRHYDNVLLVTYEEMRTEFQSVIEKIADFINVSLDDRLLEKVMKYASFNYMKHKFDDERRSFEKKFIDGIEDKEFATRRQEIFLAESQLKTIRKGEINDWKSFMTSEQSRRIYQQFMNACQGCDGLEDCWLKWNVFSCDVETDTQTAMAESDDNSTDEWSQLAQSYQDVLLPRFQPLYDTIAYHAIQKIQSKDRKHVFQVLDFGTGPGEPILTVLQQLAANELYNVKLEAVDGSQGMLTLAEERMRRINNQQLAVHFSITNDNFNSEFYDIIMTSLVLPYASNQRDMLRRFFQHLKPKGLIISSHWPHPHQVPFLSILKQVGQFMANGTRIDATHLETDISFSCWPEETTRNIFAEENFTIEQWLHIQLTMPFPNIRTLLSFFRICEWFEDSALYLKAEKETKRILHEDFHLEIQSDESFELPSQVVVVVASK